MSDTSVRLALPYLQPAQAQKHVTHNEALARLDVLVQLSVEALGASTPPANPPEGAVWGLGAAPTGDWEGQAGALAAFVDGGWLFFAPAAGWRAWDKANGALMAFDGAAWTSTGGGVPDLDNLDGVGIGTSSDPINRLAVAADATLLTHDGAGHQLKVNKAATGDTASLLFQSGWSGRAEMGLAGNDAFAIKVSADGATFTEGLRFDPATGRPIFAQGMGGTGSAAGPLGGQAIVVASERNGSFSVGSYLAFGNGATSAAGLTLPYAGKLVAMTMSISSGGAGLNTVEASLDKAAGSGFEVSHNYSGSGVGTAVASFAASPLALPAGTALSARIKTSSNTSITCVVGMVVIFD